MSKSGQHYLMQNEKALDLMQKFMDKLNKQVKTKKVIKRENDIK